MAAFDNAKPRRVRLHRRRRIGNAMRWIKDGEMEATVIYPPTQAADGIRLARLIAQDKGMSDLVQVEVPAADRAERARGDQGQRRRVHGPRLRVLTGCGSGRPAPHRSGHPATRTLAAKDIA